MSTKDIGALTSSRRVIPPYSSFAAFESLLRRAASESVPPRIDKALLIDWGIAAGNESGLITTLKSLGVVDDEGRPTELYREIRLSQPRRTGALRRTADLAYPDLTDKREPFDEDQLHDYFVEERGLTGQMVDKAMRFYRQLVDAIEHPGASLEIDTNKRATSGRLGSAARQSPAVKIAKTTRSAPPINTLTLPRMGDDTPTKPGGVGLTVVVEVPSGATEGELTDLFRKVRRAWHRSASEQEHATE